ncbi:MAG: selenide, water dikinase SelD, partial [candidate division KSB1 bacterium]|nr:selenide, water dikinase SelD [candidate division KSB1 bacterium]
EGAKPGDDLILTKPLGTGVISTALKAGKASASAIEKINAQMCELNRTAAEVMMEIGVNACTDITGFGLLGHAAQLAQASGMSLSIESDSVPIIDEAREYAAQSFFPGGTVKNLEFVRPSVRFGESVHDDVQMLLCDAQTSGGLLMSVDKSRSEEMIRALQKRGIESAMRIGEVAEQSGASIYIQ